MATAFYGCNNLNITATDVPNLVSATNMSQMFQSCILLNSPSNIGTWTTTAVTNMTSILSGATAFNQDISAWNIAAVTNMASMFQGATAFNQDISAWNIAAVTNMTSILSGATAFNQSLAAWGTKFNATVVLSNCLDNCGMSMTTYEATLTGFAATTRTGRSLGAAGLRYCNTSARTTLVTATPTGKGWTITGDVKECTTDAFITRWDLSKTGASTTALTFGVQVASTGATAYTWTNVGTGATGSGTLAANATTLSISGLPANAIIEVKINPINFQRININNGADKERLLDVSQWGTTAWTSMATAFYGCNNLNITATDVPNLVSATNMSQMFQSCILLNSPSNIGTWNTAAVTNMSGMFQSATAFNQNIGAWNTAAVTNMSGMFQSATAFNQNIGTWNTVKVTDMSFMFNGATAFNQNIGAWNTVTVTNMSTMFQSATAFNQNIGTWNTAAVTNMSYMFYQETAFNQNIGAWNTANVTNMSYMFTQATAFNQNISTWNTAKVTNMTSMFNSATAFNQPIGTWTTTAVINMSLMFSRATAFNQNIGTWNVAAVTDMSIMFHNATAFNQSLAAWGTKFNAAVILTNCLDNCGMSIANYEATLTGFAATTRTGRSLGAAGLKYCNTSARTILTNPVASGGKGWTITGDVQDCAVYHFVTRWDLSKAGASATALTFGVQVASTGAATYTWSTVPAGTSGSGTMAANATSVTISGLPANAIIEVKIEPKNFESINIYNGADKARLVDVSTWGTTAWTSMASAFSGCNNLNITATDVPNLTGVTNMTSMFTSCTLLNGPSNIGAWNTVKVTNMSWMFYGAAAFNQNIGAWNTAAVTDMSYMFINATVFNQNIGTWNTAKVTNMSNMFRGAAAFNQNIGVWNTAAVTDMLGMFQNATVFNQNIGTWNTAAVTDMLGMFNNATAFNQDISAWNTAKVTNMSWMFYKATAFNQDISAWNTAAVMDMSTMFAQATAFNQDISAWNIAAATNMTSMFAQTTAFNQDISAWSIAAATNMSSMFHNATAFNQSLAAWGTKFNAAVSLTNCLNNCGMSMANYEATLTGFAATTRTGRSLGAADLKYCNATDRTILVTPIASGGKGWTITGDVTDCPTDPFITRWDLSKTGSSTTALTFGVAVASTGAATYTWSTIPVGTSGSGSIAANATSVTISGLPVGAIIEVKINPTNFQRINIYNGTDRERLLDVSQWGTTAWTSMGFAFYGCNNLNITAIDVPTLTGVTDMSFMFASCTTLNSPSNIGTWNTATITNMASMFSAATAFNQNIGTWNTAAVTTMSYMFFNGRDFNQNISTWNTANVTNMSYMFYNARDFNQNISTWNTIKVTDMSWMFASTTSFNQNISAWNTAAVTNMSRMFSAAKAFNQNISTLNTAAVTNMSYMFYYAPIFNQNIGAWNIAAVTDMSNMFRVATSFNQSLAAWGTKFNAAVDLTNCLDFCGMNVSNYDATLTGFATTSSATTIK